ncbi:MAG: hypothetical protein JW912_04085 [Sedimentisphaerales bacterium]|nr:hypothetical protein [Sedimentisphaerales bacterium]
MQINIYAAWVGIFLGCIAGAATGLFFHNEQWLGGYTSWQRRMIRLGHISFFGIAFINLSFALTANTLQIQQGLTIPSTLFVIGAVAMPLVCYLSATKKIFRNLFFIPAMSVIIGVIFFLLRIFAK